MIRTLRRISILVSVEQSVEPDCTNQLTCDHTSTDSDGYCQDCMALIPTNQ